MKFRSFIFTAVAALAAVVSCQEKPVDFGDPRVELDQTELNFSQDAGEQNISFVSTRSWAIKDLPDWIAAEPAKGEASLDKQNVTISVLPNTAGNRSATITVSGGIEKAYITINQEGPGGAPKTGDGTKASPYTSSYANELGAALADGEQLADVFVSGIVSTIKSIDPSFGNAEYYISDDGTNANEFYIYRGYSLGGNKFKTTDELKVGDAVVVYGTIINFKGDTVEMTTGSKIVSLNGEESEGGQGGGSDELITGTDLLTNGGFEDWTGDKPAGWDFTNGNATLVKSSDAFEGSNACEVQGSDQNKRLMSREYKLSAGTYQIQAQIKGSGAFRLGYAKLTNGKVATSDDYIYVNSVTNASSDWTRQFVSFTLAADTDISISIMNSKNGGGKSIFVDDVKLVTKDGGLRDGGDTPPAPVNIVPATVAEVLAGQDTEVIYRISGTVSNFESKYCSFDITDNTGSIYVYSVTSATKAAYSDKLKDGDTVTIEGTYSYYASKDQHEIVDATITAWSGDDGGEGSGDGVDPSTLSQITCAQFNALPENDENWYILEGKVISITGAKYGNLYIKDDSGEMAYIYGVRTADGQDGAFETLNVAVGDILKVYGQHTIYIDTYNGDAKVVEMKNGVFMSVEKNETAQGNVLFTLTFPDDNKDSNKVNGYDDLWTAMSGSYSFKMVQFNNYEWNNWTYIRCGRKKDSTASISSSSIDKPVSKVVVTFDSIDTKLVSSAKMYVASDADFKNVVETVSVNPAMGEVEYAVASPAANLYYKLEYVCKTGTKNGFVQISKIAFIGE